MYDVSTRAIFYCWGGGGGEGGGVFVVLYGKSLGTNCIWVYACMHMHEFGTHTWCIAHTIITPFMHGKCVDHAQLLTAFLRHACTCLVTTK